MKEIRTSSLEAKVGLQVEDLWDVQEPQLSPSEKLNACFESIPVSSFPHSPNTQVIEINSDTSVAEAVKLMAQHNILSVPVVDVDAPENATWIDRYLGIIEFAGIVVWILHQSEKKDGSAHTDFIPESEPAMSSAIARAASGMSSPRYNGVNPFDEASISGGFFVALTNSEFYKNAKLSKYRMKSVPVVDLGVGKIENIITQSAVIHMLEECAGLQWFESWGTKKLSELGLPLMKPNRVVKVCEDEPVLQAFKLMRQKGVGAVPVVESGGGKAIGNISVRDIQFLLLAPAIYKNHRSITAKSFLSAVRSYHEEHQKSSPILSDVVTCTRDDMLKEVIMKLDSMKIHRIYVANGDGKLDGVITVRDIISKLVHEPRGYFGDFFDGVLPQPVNNRV
ncbi:SNF1-related protein kinase regulatory subunit gamma-1-like isoform X2 [Apium graveolens]|uniref:SNF1-related protein kinase regulatory subunit gamma-1-like isoform X2 n=1 Tax=Apium graveolens TaxID=4045 RepID=UPI003D7BE92A